MMAVKFKHIIQSLLVNDFSWTLIRPFAFIIRRLEASRQNYKHRDENNRLYELGQQLYGDGLVRRGIFKGMTMKGVMASGSNYFAKLAGVYEEVLQPELEGLLKKDYSRVVNVGSDEGYYAIGLALRTGLPVLAFDCEPKARENTRLLAAQNGVGSRVVVEACFAADKLPDDQSSLFIIDCEGCESTIFIPDFVSKNCKSDFVVELHYETKTEIDFQLMEVLRETHHLRLITAIPDEIIVRNCGLQELAGLSLSEKMYLLGERPHFTQWLIAEAVKR